MLLEVTTERMANYEIFQMKTYQELITFPNFEERFNYLATHQKVSDLTFGSNRKLNQMFYQSPEWKRIRRLVIIRDGGCDLACSDRPINSTILIHHINPITVDDVVERRPCVFDLNNLITCSFDTHQQIHYGSLNGIVKSEPVERKPNDTIPWR